MAKGQIMLQIDVDQVISPAVSDAPAVWAVAIDFLDGERTIVREIATEKSHQFYGWADEGHAIGTLAFDQNAATDLWLALPRGQETPAILHAPSHVDSPPIDGPTIVLLRVRDYGFSFDPSTHFVLGRYIGSHAYVDEIPLPG